MLRSCLFPQGHIAQLLLTDTIPDGHSHREIVRFCTRDKMRRTAKKGWTQKRATINEQKKVTMGSKDANLQRLLMHVSNH